MPKRKDIHSHFSVTAVSSGTLCYLYIYKKSAYVFFYMWNVLNIYLGMKAKLLLNFSISNYL